MLTGRKLWTAQVNLYEALSPDERVLYVVESRAKPHRLVWAYDVGGEGSLSSRRVVIDAAVRDSKQAAA